MVGLGCWLLAPVVEVFMMRLVTSVILLTTEVSVVIVLVSEKVSPKNWPVLEIPCRKQSADWHGWALSLEGQESSSSPDP